MRTSRTLRGTNRTSPLGHTMGRGGEESSAMASDVESAGFSVLSSASAGSPSKRST